MEHTAMAKGPVFDGNYAPYFYQSGKFLAYGIPGKSDLNGSLNRGYSKYDFTSDLVSKSTWPRQPTVEDIIQKGYFAIPKSEPEMAIISDKKQTSGLGLGDIISQVRQRYEIYERNNYQIELGKCYAISSALTIESERGGVPLNSKEVYGLNKNIQKFYEQQRDERTSLWQDVSRLKQSLPEQAQQYLSAYRKVSILEDDIGDGP
jgi:hypothetical protein